MIKIENTVISGWEPTIRGMRNPLNSWEKSDSYWTHVENKETLNTGKFEFFICENDLQLMKRLSAAGNDHAKYLRFIDVTVDITAPLYWWKEFDTYKVGTVVNSCSTMHKIHSKDFTLEDFSCDHLDNDILFQLTANGERKDDDFGITAKSTLEIIISVLNEFRKLYLETHNKHYWWQLIQLLPSSYNQKRTVKLNYQVLKSMYFARRNHKLDEWHDLCNWIEGLTVFKDICIEPEMLDEDYTK